MKKLSIFYLLFAFAACKPATQSNTQAPTQTDKNKTVYTCSMHPEIKSNKPGMCPKCGMDLTEKQN